MDLNGVMSSKTTINDDIIKSSNIFFGGGGVVTNKNNRLVSGENQTREDIIDIITHQITARVIAYSIHLTDIKRLRIKRFSLLEEKQELRFYLDVSITVTLTKEFLNALDVEMDDSEVMVNVHLEVGVVGWLNPHILNVLIKKGVDHLDTVNYILDSEVLDTSTSIYSLTDSHTGEPVSKNRRPGSIVKDLVKNIPYRIELKVENNQI